MIQILSGDSGAAKPYANLLPLVDVLRGHGNTLLFNGDGFFLTQDGWCCELRDPIDFDFVEATFVFPESIVFSRQHDRIVDNLTHAEINGPGGHEPRVSSPEGLDQREKLRLALATLPELDRYLLYQRYFKYASTEELAAKTGLTRHAVDTRLWQSRKRFRDADQ